MTLTEWLNSRNPASRWRTRARDAMKAAVKGCLNTDVDVAFNQVAVLTHVDAAYPFGPRSHHPYKAWLQERQILCDVLWPPDPPPTADDYAACEVALDIVAAIPDLERQALELLNAQAPNRLNRKCPVCAATPGDECWSLDEKRGGYRMRLIVPHLGRVMPERAAQP